MRIVFLGDIAMERPPVTPLTLPAVCQQPAIVVANLEGAIASSEIVVQSGRGPFLPIHNSLDVLDLLERHNVRGVILANNHLFDISDPLTRTVEQLERIGVNAFGAGLDLASAQEPVTYSENGTTTKIFAFSWEVIGSKLAAQQRPGVNPMTAENAFQIARSVRESDTDSFVIFIMHWNYELELYPQPAHRQLAHDLIREGVDAVIGLHPHVAQGAESVDGKPLVYSLGNWYFPPRRLGDFQLSFPPVTSRQLALTIDVEGRNVKRILFNWYHFDPKETILQHEKSEGWDGSILRRLTPFAGMSHQAYCRWFRTNRTRRRGLPIYYNYQHSTRNRAKDLFVQFRQRFVETLVRLKVKQRLSEQE